MLFCSIHCDHFRKILACMGTGKCDVAWMKKASVFVLNANTLQILLLLFNFFSPRCSLCGWL